MIASIRTAIRTAIPRRPRFSHGVALVALAAGSIALPAARALPALPAVPGASSNVSLVTVFPDIQTMGGRFIGHYLVTTGTAGMRIYDATNPEQPALVSDLPMPIFSNEDVEISMSRKLVLISSDLGGQQVPGSLVVVDIADPSKPAIRGVLSYATVPTPHGERIQEVGHIANCINDCARYAYVTGGSAGSVLVVDLADAAVPKAAGWVQPFSNKANPTVKSGIVHDVFSDSRGGVWVTGSEGISDLDVRNPLRPKERVRTRQADADRLDQLVFHNTERLDSRTLLITEEDWLTANCKTSISLKKRDEGSFQTWEIPKGDRGFLKPLDQWTTELGQYVDGGAPAAVACSSHWFDVNARKIVAASWYQQGIRFLDVSKPRDIRQVGYYIPPWESAGLGFSQTLFVPGHDDLVYGMSLTSGLTVLRIDRGGAKAPTVVAPVLRQWFGPRPVSFQPHPRFGYACPIGAA